jgi:UDP-N-acetylmuramate dehydrogenase
LSSASNPKLDYADLKKVFADANTPTLGEVRAAIVAIRAAKFPDWSVVGTAGSFFKNPIVSGEEAARLKQEYPDLPVYSTEAGMFKISLGYVLDKVCGLKGYREGDIGLYEAQALVLVNYGEGNGDEVEKFAAGIAEKVFAKTKIKIEPEVRFIKN